jgi:hypothetical protein
MALQKKFYVALAMLSVLALLAWLTLDDGTVFRFPVPVSVDRGGVVFGALAFRLRSLTLAVLGLFALRTWLHWHAEKIRAERERERSEAEFMS